MVAGEDMVMFRQGELKRLHVIRKVLERVVKEVEAAEILSLSCRQVQRVVQRVKGEGNKGVIPKSRGKVSSRRFRDGVRERVIKLYRKRYSGFGPTLASEKFLEREKIKLSDETLRGWLLVSGDWKKVRRRRVHRQGRERREHLGEMVQMDGSGHDWFEGRGPNCVLMGYIDDATGVVTDCKSGPVLQNPIKDPARFQWHEVKKVEHYYLSVDAVTRPMQIKENPTQFGDQEK